MTEAGGAPFEPTEEQRRLVRALSGLGVAPGAVARQVGCDAEALRRHFADDLERGAAETTAKVAQSLLQMATTGKNVAAAIFWMKARAGWRERSEVEHSLRRGFVVRAEDMSDEELMRIVAGGGEDAPAGPVVVAPSELTGAEWTARYGRGAAASRDDGDAG